MKTKNNNLFIRSVNILQYLLTKINQSSYQDQSAINFLIKTEYCAEYNTMKNLIIDSNVQDPALIAMKNNELYRHMFYTPSKIRDSYKSHDDNRDTFYDYCVNNNNLSYTDMKKVEHLMNIHPITYNDLKNPIIVTGRIKANYSEIDSDREVYENFNNILYSKSSILAMQLHKAIFVIPNQIDVVLEQNFTHNGNINKNLSIQATLFCTKDLNGFPKNQYLTKPSQLFTENQITISPDFNNSDYIYARPNEFNENIDLKQNFIINIDTNTDGS